MDRKVKVKQGWSKGGTEGCYWSVCEVGGRIYKDGVLYSTIV